MHHRYDKEYVYKSIIEKIEGKQRNHSKKAESR
jgi:hypothetical protein